MVVDEGRFALWAGPVELKLMELKNYSARLLYLQRRCGGLGADAHAADPIGYIGYMDIWIYGKYMENV